MMNYIDVIHSLLSGLGVFICILLIIRQVCMFQKHIINDLLRYNSHLSSVITANRNDLQALSKVINSLQKQIMENSRLKCVHEIKKEPVLELEPIVLLD